MPNQPQFKTTQQLGNFEGAMQQNFCPKCRKSNLTKFQAQILQEIRSDKHIIIAHADKNLGPVGVDTERYIRWALNEHLLDRNTYIQERKEEAQTSTLDLFTEIYMWMRRHQMCSNLTKDATAYIRYWIQKNHHDPFEYFYLTVKIHKGPLSTCPVCSDCASLVHPLRKWLDYTLQPVVACQPFYFKDSFLLKQEIDKLVLPPNASINTFDAVAMYTNIDINNSINQIMKFLSEIWDKYDCKAVEEAMNIVMQNNPMQFGDLIFRQTCGVAMGMLPAPTIANLYDL
jgi:hypothetical protein